MTLKEDRKRLHIPKEVIANIIKVFLLGVPWKTLSMGDMIIDTTTNEVWCRWREFQSLRSGMVNSLKRSPMTKALAVEMEKIFKEMKEKR